MGEEDTRLIVDAFKSVKETLDKMHSVFLLAAAASVLALIITIGGAVWYTSGRNSRMEDRLLKRQDEMHSQMRDLREKLDIRQNVNIGVPRTFDDNVRDVLKKNGELP